MSEKIVYDASDFDTCIENDPALFGLEEYMVGERGLHYGSSKL